MIDTIGKIDKALRTTKPILEIFGNKVLPEVKQFSDRMYILAESYPSLERFVTVLDRCTDILKDVLFVLGVETDETEILGIKIIQADKSMNDFESTEEYIEYLKNEGYIYTEDMDNMNEFEKIAYTIMGIALNAVCISEKMGIGIGADFWTMLAKLTDNGTILTDASKIVDFIFLCKEKNLFSLDSIVDYFKGTGDVDRISVGKILNDIFEILAKGRSEDIIEKIKYMARE